MQGDIVWDCYALQPPSDITKENIDDLTIIVKLIHVDVIIISQSCDLVEGLEKVNSVLCAPIIRLSEYEANVPGFLTLGSEKKEKKREQLRQGLVPGIHVLNFYPDVGFKIQEYVVVNFHDHFTFDIGYMRRLVREKGKRLRLLPPYREQLSYSFSKHITRVGLPAGRDLLKYLKYPLQE